MLAAFVLPDLPTYHAALQRLTPVWRGSVLNGRGRSATAGQILSVLTDELLPAPMPGPTTSRRRSWTLAGAA